MKGKELLLLTLGIMAVGLVAGAGMDASSTNGQAQMPMTADQQARWAKLSATGKQKFGRFLAALAGAGYRLAWIETVGTGHVPGSRHDKGNAIDLNLFLPNGARLNKYWVEGGQDAGTEWNKVGLLAESLGIRWGGRFSTPDPNHFDI